MEEEIQTKKCSRCGEVKPISDFNKRKSRKDGLQSYCKQCKKAMNAEWRAKHPTYDAEYCAKNKEKKAAYKADYRDPQTHPLNWARMMVAHYRRMDRDRGFDTSQTITAEWFVQNIMYKPCAHCGLLQVGAIGVNRKSNALGHIPSNCEPCCQSCNSRQNCKDMLARGIHMSCKHKKVAFKEFVKKHNAKSKKIDF